MTEELRKMKARVAELERLDREAATHVESLICMRTHFTGEPPYVGWRGLGLALKEHLDSQAAEIAALRVAISRMRQGYRAIMRACGDGSIGDDVIWFDDFTTLFDQCAAYLGDDLSDEEYQAMLNGEAHITAAAYGREK